MIVLTTTAAERIHHHERTIVFDTRTVIFTVTHYLIGTGDVTQAP